jgi:hypothetical protein
VIRAERQRAGGQGEAVGGGGPPPSELDRLHALGDRKFGRGRG